MRKYLIVFILCFPLLIMADDSQSLFNKGNTFYQKEEYDKAIEQYDKLLKQGYESSELYYNLGNSYYKTGNIPSSILNYERALKLSPSDEDIILNLKLANLKIIDKIEPLPQLFYIQW